MWIELKNANFVFLLFMVNFVIEAWPVLYNTVYRMLQVLIEQTNLSRVFANEGCRMLMF